MNSNKTIIGIAANELMESVSSHVQKYPRWLQPLAMICSTIIAILMAICSIPFFLLFLFRRKYREHNSNMKKLKLDISRVWAEKSPDAAVSRLREVITEIESSQSLSVLVEPYGHLLNAPALSTLWPMLYEYEVTLHNWENGFNIAEKSLQLLEGKDSSGYWNRAKARCLIELGRYGEAKQHIFSVRNPEHTDPELEKLLEEAKQTSK